MELRMISAAVKYLSNEISTTYAETRDIDALERELNRIEQAISSNAEVVDEEDKAFLVYQRYRINFYKYGTNFPNELLDQCILTGHMSSIEYRLRNAYVLPMTPEIAEFIKNALTKIFKSNDKTTINYVSAALLNCIDYGNALNLSSDQRNSFELAAEGDAYEKSITKIKVGNIDIHTDELSVADWKKFVVTLFEILQKHALNEQENRIYIVNDKLHFLSYDSKIDICYQNHILLSDTLDYDFGDIADFTNIIGRINAYLIDLAEKKAKGDSCSPAVFVSELEEKNPNVDWLNLPKERAEIKATLFRPD